MRTARLRQEWALQDVEAITGGEFKAASVSAYERGERAISVERLLRIAQLYAVEPMELVPPLAEARGRGGSGKVGAPDGAVGAGSSGAAPPKRDAPDGPDGPDVFRSHPTRLRVDLVRLQEMSGPGWEQAQNLVLSIHQRRKSRAGRYLDVRAGDVWMVAALFGSPASEGLDVLLREGVVKIA